MAKRDLDLLSQIEEDVLTSAPLADTLRKCIVLGGKAGSEHLREWATRELRGYGPDDEPPEYRTVGAMILADAVVGNSHVKGQHLGAAALPELVRDNIDDHFEWRQGVGEIEAIVAEAKAAGLQVKIALPMAPQIASMIDEESGNPYQQIHALYWSMSPAAVGRIVEQVRTTLAELVAEMRVATPESADLPSKSAVDGAVNVAVRGGKRTTVVVQHGVGGNASITHPRADDDVDGAPWWKRSKTIAAGVAGLASVVGLGLAAAQWQGWI